MLLSRMKQILEDFLDYKVTDAVITVSSYFNESQRQTTIDECRIAGLYILRIINEPIAAVIAYGLDKDNENGKYILEFDLGERTCDISILKSDLIQK